jgi:serine/threonine-protein kinase
MLSEYALENDPHEQLRRACAELSERLRAGEDCRAESFFDSYPALASSAEHALELILTEFAVRRELGQQPDPNAWCARFPQWREQLLHHFQLRKILGDSELPDPSTVPRTPPATPDEHPGPPRAGVRFAHYEVLEVLGRGGMGVVYKARDVVLGRAVALKMIRAGVLAEPEEVERFYREARAVASLSHPHIVPLYEIRRHEERHYFTMAYAPGGSLAQQRPRLGADPRQTAALVEKIARAVHYAHTRGILHRDLKPGNVLLDERGEPLVSDFGLAKFLGADAELTQSGQRLGTPAYMAPELIAAEPSAATVQSDVWALGILLFELLAGQRPFTGKGFKEVSQQIQTSYPQLRTLQPTLDRNLETVVLKCLEKEPARRYVSAEALAGDLARWLRGEPVVARPAGWPRKTWRTLRRHSLVTVASLLLGAAILAVPVAIHFADPERHLRSIERKLAEGEQVILIGESGPPDWFEPRAGQVGLIPPRGRDKLFTINSVQPGLLELVPDPQHPYHFRATVRHNRGARAGEVGLYFACSKHPTPQGQILCFCTLTFSDKEALYPRGGGKWQSLVKLSLHRWNGLSKVRDATIASCPFDPDSYRRVGNLSRRQLAVVVSDQTLQCFWEGEMLFTKTTAELKREFQNMQSSKRRPDEGPELQPDFTFRDSLGLYTYNSEAAFQTVVVSPLKD